MDKWWKVLVSCIIVLLVSFIFRFQNLPSGVGKIFAYLGIGFIPVLIFQLNLLRENSISTGMFVFALVMNTFLVLFFTLIIKVIITIITGINFI
jgi:hypothetical protein